MLGQIVRAARRGTGLLLTSALFLGPAYAAADDGLDALSQLSLEQLANVTVISVSKHAEPLSGAASAVFVISAEDIHRSGANSLPEALRLAPNLEVAQLNAYSYTVTARGFNSPESANKLLVLIDGRSVYSPLSATVFWDSLDIPVDTIDRIEVISGAGGTLWGANAVNGVINIITKSARKMQGFALDANIGSFDRTGTLSYGGVADDHVSYRAYVSGFDRAPTSAFDPLDLTSDAWRGLQAGGRVDGQWDNDTYRLEGAIYGNATHGDPPGQRNQQSTWGGNITARWHRDLDDQSSFGVQTYYSRDGRTSPVLSELLNTYDIVGQYNTALWSDHKIAVGGEFRLWHETLQSFNPFSFAEPGATLTLGSLFVQDEFPLTSSLRLTLGFKGEENNYSGFDYLPSARLAWQLDPDDLLWAAISRSVRTPSRIDRELQFPGLLAPAPDFESESLVAFEAGYRGQLGQRFSLSVSSFFNLYDSLRSDGLTNGGLPIILQNGIAGHSFGVEAWGKYNAFDWWKLAAGANWLHRDYHLKPGFVDISIFQSIGQDPPWQASLRSEMNVTPELEFDATLRAVGHVMRLFNPIPIELVSGYAEMDARIGWLVTPSLELSVQGTNLLHPRHIEVNDPSTAPTRYIPRQVSVALRARL
jgi:iron complex outermembrane receptor protein